MLSRNILIIALVLICGYIIGYSVSHHQYELANQNTIQFSEIMEIIQHNYIDSIDFNIYNQLLIKKIFKYLDPFSTYYDPNTTKMINDNSAGKFYGIGIEFHIVNDTIVITHVIPAGPAIESGLLPGDKIIAINDSSAINLPNTLILKKVRGRKDEPIKITIQRPNIAKAFDIIVIRDEIKLLSVDATLIFPNKIGYIKVNRFSQTTYDEFDECLKMFIKENIEHLILDLRGNTGGLLDQVIKVTNEFLEKDMLIVSTEGRSGTNLTNYFSDFSGRYKSGSLIVLVDNLTASASEILAGAIQDHKRGLIFGNKTYGKGLIQRQFPIGNAKSLVRLTVAQYKTPSGRSIQKKYTLEEPKIFAKNSYNSQQVDLDNYGITPDVIVEVKQPSPFVRLLSSEQYFTQNASQYVNMLYREYQDFIQFDSLFVMTTKLNNMLLNDLNAKYPSHFNEHWNKDEEEILQLLKIFISRKLFGDEGYYYSLLRNDETFQKALSRINDMNGK